MRRDAEPLRPWRPLTQAGPISSSLTLEPGRILTPNSHEPKILPQEHGPGRGGGHCRRPPRPSRGLLGNRAIGRFVRGAGPHRFKCLPFPLAFPPPALRRDEKARPLLRGYGVASAWTGSFDALLHRDISAVNARLARECETEGAGLLVPFGAVNPTLPGWEEDLRRCAEVHRMPGIRLHPDFHGYTLEDARFSRLLEMATARGLIVQIGLGMEDPRTQAPLARLDAVHPGPLADLLPKMPKARVVLLNFFRSFEYNRVLLFRMSNLPQVSFDLATSDGLDGIHLLLESVPTMRLLFGSFAPFYNFDSSRLKLQESVLTPEQLAAIRHKNAEAILQPA